MLRRLIYTSRASQTMTPATLLDILDTSRHNNDSRAITGMLVFANGDFLQVIEGPEDAIETLFNRIQDDPRHTHCRVFSDTTIAERLFKDWHMGFREIDKSELTQRPGFIDFFNPDMTPKALENPISSAQFLLLGFKDLQLEAQGHSE